MILDDGQIELGASLELSGVFGSSHRLGKQYMAGKGLDIPTEARSYIHTHVIQFFST